MKLQSFSSAICFLPALLPFADAAPAKRDTDHPLRGSTALVGYSASEKVASGTKPDIKYSLLPEQKANPDIGAYLDFENVKNPQPIRGSTGSDDPGPRKFAIHQPCTRAYHFPLR